MSTALVMILNDTPLLALQRDLYRIPRGPDRFRAYIRLMQSPDRPSPLSLMNPMARDHVPALLDEFLALDADRIASEAAHAVAAHLPDLPGPYQLSLVVVDDLLGGWTNRHAVELAHAADPLGQSWLAGILWSSEPASPRVVLEAARLPLHRAAHAHRHGPPKTLRHFLHQEGRALAASGCDSPTFDPDDLAYTRAVLAPHLDADLPSILIPCLYGDPAAITLGHVPLGLSPRAGLALALHDAKFR